MMEDIFFEKYPSLEIKSKSDQAIVHIKNVKNAKIRIDTL